MVKYTFLRAPVLTIDKKVMAISSSCLKEWLENYRIPIVTLLTPSLKGHLRYKTILCHKVGSP